MPDNKLFKPDALPVKEERFQILIAALNSFTKQNYTEMAESIEEIKSAILVAQKSGDYLKEYDLAQTGLGTYPNDEFFQYCSVLALSRCNAKQRALDSFYSYKLHLSGNEYVRALEPRILKDLAFLSVDIAKKNPFIGLDKAKFSASDRREPHAILFSDIRGFSKLCDRGIIWYFKELQPTLARIVEQYRLEIQHLDTWGYAIFWLPKKLLRQPR